MSDRLAPANTNSEYDDPNPNTLFISYARKDVEFAQKLNADLQRHGVTTWIDELGIRGGEDWPNRIATAIEGCKAMLVILSPDSVASRWVQRELAFADAKGKRVLPLLYKPCRLPAWFELRFGNVQRADFSRGSYETNLTKLLASIEQVLGLTVATPAPVLRRKPPTEPTPSVLTVTSTRTQQPIRWIPPTKPTPDVLTITSPIHLELVRVPAGEFLMGSDPAKDKDARDNEQPQHRVYVSEFYIGKYPVTNAQYAVFAKAVNGKYPVTNAQYAVFAKAITYRTPSHWKGGKISSGKENHPVVYVSWHDAVAFCQWLSQETSRAFRLPTEAEWEKAARGTDGRIYPWGNEWDKTKLNSKEGGPGGTTPVGQYSPAGDSPYGAADMSGNVWEWCADWYDEGEYQRRAKSTVQDPQGPDSRKYFKRDSLLGDGFLYRDGVRRGGSWSLGQHCVRSAYRSGYGPSSGDFSSGFRVVVVSPGSP